MLHDVVEHILLFLVYWRQQKNASITFDTPYVKDNLSLFFLEFFISSDDICSS